MTLARMVVTLESDEIMGKEEAAQQVCARLAAPHAGVVDLARLRCARSDLAERRRG